MPENADKSSEAKPLDNLSEPPVRNAFGQLREQYEKVRPSVKNTIQDMGISNIPEIRKAIQKAAFKGALTEHDKQQEAAGRDDLTGFLNKKGYYRALEAELKRVTRNEKPVTIVFGDPNGLKSVNDAFGHKYGDELIVEYARRLSQDMRAGDSIARFAGDEFIYILPNTDVQDIPIWGNKRIHAIQDQFATLSNGHNVPLALGLGSFTILPDTCRDILKKGNDEELRKFFEDQTNNADIAMYFSKKISKETGKLRVMRYEDLSVEQIDEYQKEKSKKAGSPRED